MSVNQISLDTAKGQLNIGGTADDDQVVVSMDSPSVIRVRAESIDGVVERTFQRSAVSLIYYYGGDGNDHFENSSNVSALALGQGGNDFLSGGSAVDELRGGAGDDELVGNGGDDTLLGGDGNDVLRGGDGNDGLLGELGHDWADGGAGNDTISGQSGNDTLYGADGADIIIGNSGDDLIYGGGGNDQIQGDDGNDQLYGEAGDDSILGGSGADQIFGGDNADSLFGEDGDDYVDGMAGDDVVSGGAGNNSMMGGLGNDQLLGGSGVDSIRGGEGHDWLYGYEGNDRLEGEGGNDVLFGGVGADILIGGDGDDALYGEAGNDSLFGNSGNDVLAGGDGNDTLYAAAGNDYLVGNTGNDILWGGADNDRLEGNDGYDRLEGEDGDDILFGGNDDDLLNGGRDDDSLYGEAGSDSLQGGDGVDVLLGGIGNDVLNGGDGDDTLYGEDGDDSIHGSSGNDYLIGGIGNDTLLGGDGDDLIHGSDGRDTLFGEAGNDQLFGMEGDDTLFGDADNDYLRGGAGNDALFGGSGDDEIYGEAGDDGLDGMIGNDRLTGGDGNDTLHGGDGNDQLFGSAGNDALSGHAGNDFLQGMEGDDMLYGGAGDDYLIGNEDSDWLSGEDGDDEIVGFGDSDFLLGGNGADRISSQTGQHALIGGNGEDVLTGGSGRDLIIGGAGRDQILGGGGDDLLIGGATNYDAGYVQLQALFAAWTSGASYAERVAQIESDSSAAQLKSNTTVMDDAIADQIYGGSGQDWFFLTGFVATYDPNSTADHDHTSSGSTTTGGHTHGGAVVIDEPPTLEGFAFVDSLDKIGDQGENELLHTLVPHANNPSLQREHLTLTQLVRYDQVTHYAVASGDWSSPNTWSDGVVPSNGARVLIPIGVEVTVDQVLATRINTIRVDGTLSFSTVASSELRVDTIVVTSIGRFEMGTVESPVPANITAKVLFTDNGEIDRVADPYALGRGLISHGSVSIHGAAVTSHVALNGSATAGAAVVTFKTAPAGWKVGDTIVVAGTFNGSRQNEERRIVAINGNRVTLDRALRFNHMPLTAAQEIHVANTTRNVQFASESSASDRRGHVMFMHSRDVHVANAGFYKLGRTDKEVPINDPVVDESWHLVPGTGTNPRARYSVHFHRTGSNNDGNPSLVTGSVVVDSPGWGFVNHSSYVNMVDNVSFAVHGASFVTEVGDEIGSFVGNIAIGTTGSGEATESRLGVQDFGHQGDGFWIQGTGVAVVNNVAAGNDGSAFIIFARGLVMRGVAAEFLASNLPDPSVANGADTVPINSVPMRLFIGNVGYTSAIGLSVWYHLENALDATPGIFAGSNFWNNTNGVDLAYSNQVVLRDLVISRMPEQAPFPTKSTGVNANLITRNVIYENLTVSGYWRGVFLPRRGYANVVNGSFNNHLDFHIVTAASAGRTVLLTGNISMNRLEMDTYFTYPDNPLSFVFASDRVTLNFGSFQNQRAYYEVQSPFAVPFPTPLSGIPEDYVGKTSLVLWTQYGVAVGGELAPADAVTLPGSNALIAPAN